MSYIPCHQRVQQYLHRGRGSAWAPPRGCSYANCAGENTRLGMCSTLWSSDFPSVYDTRPVLPGSETICQPQKCDGAFKFATASTHGAAGSSRASQATNTGTGPVNGNHIHIFERIHWPNVQTIAMCRARSRNLMRPA